MKVNWTDEQQRAMKRLYGQFVKPGSLVFNVGANIGTRTQVFVELGAKVVALEPQPEMAAILRKKFPCTKADVTIVEAAAGPVDGTTILIVFPGIHSASCAPGWIAAGAGGLKRPVKNWDTPMEVRQVTLDSLIAHYDAVDFMKIDVEGYEREVVKGLSPWAAPNILCFEATMSYLDAALDCLFDLHGRLGFSGFNYVVMENMKLMLDEWVGVGEMAAILKGMPLRIHYCDVFAK